jgi:hypothetical protein
VEFCSARFSFQSERAVVRVIGTRFGHPRPALADLDARRDQEQHGVEVVLFRDDAAFAQELG